MEASRSPLQRTTKKDRCKAVSIDIALIGSLPPPPHDVSALTISGVVLVSIIGGTMPVFGVLGLVVAHGCWNGRGWAWTSGTVIAVIGLTLREKTKDTKRQK